MARRRRKNDSAGGTIIALLGVFLVYVVPFVILLGWAAAEVWAAAASRDRAARLVALQDEETARAAQVDRLWQEGLDNGLARRGDGMFDERSRAGRTLNNAIEAEAAALDDTQVSLDGVMRPIIWRATLRVAAAVWVIVWASLSLSQGHAGQGPAALASIGALIAGGIAWLMARNAIAGAG